jgi:hypothetical protein
MVEKTIIANYGDPNLGKTESIKKLYELLKPFDESKEPFYYKPEEHHGDLCARLIINNIPVGISSPGDPDSYQERWLKELIEKENCRIIVVACQHSGDTVKVIENYTKANDYRIYWTSNARLFEDRTNSRVAPKGILDRFNENWAEEIANLIESWCYV